MLPSSRASDQAAKACTIETWSAGTWSARSETTQHQEHGEAAGERRQRQRVPAALEQVDRVAAEALEARAAPRDRLAAELHLDPAREARRRVADVAGQAVAVEHEHERGDDDAEDRGADERRGGEECRPARR